jgi:hypothetical protein
VSTFLIDDVLEEMAKEGRKHFSPHYVCARTGIADLKFVTEHMLTQVGKKLRVYFEVECPEGDSDFPVNNPLDIVQEERECHICGIKYTPNPEKVWIAFDFLPPYLEHVKKKLRGQPNLLLQTLK